MKKVVISIIIPFFNEEENLPALLQKLETQLNKIPQLSSSDSGRVSMTHSEIVLVNDGSTRPFKELIRQYLQKENIVLVEHNRQMGKGKALQTGLEAAKGEIIFFMDADLQDDPADIPKFLQKLDESYDFVNGYRYNRQDNFVIKLYSTTASWFLRNILHSPYSDINCGFKAFRRKVLDKVAMYGNNFRWFPLGAFYEGYKVTEVKVENHPRIHGKSKFGMSKIVIGLIDMLSAYFLYKFAEKPLHFFGMIGGALFLPGFLLAFILSIQRIFYAELLYRRPLLQLALLLMLVGIQVGMTGILGELIVYMSHKSKVKSQKS